MLYGERCNLYRLNHMDKYRAYSKKYYQLHKEKVLKTNKDWFRTHREKANEYSKIQKSKRRNLGFVPLNEKTHGTVAHHLCDIHVIYIPENMHKKCNYPDRETHRKLVLSELSKL